MESSDYEELFYDEFNSHFKKVAKKYKHSFEHDFEVLLKVIRATKEESPQTEQISGLGQDITLPIYKIRMHIKETQQKSGRVIFLLDHKNKTIAFIDVYTKNDQENHNVELIKSGYRWYLNKLKI